MKDRRTYRSWYSMKDRCDNKDSKSYKGYGAKGIGYCEEWGEFDNFLLDMGLRPEGMTLDRIDNSLGYCKSNCKWSTPLEQANNKSDTIFLEYDGVKLSIAEWARRLGITHSTMLKRYQAGFDKSKLFKKGKNRTKPTIKYNGMEKSIPEWATYFGVSKYKIRYHLEKGKTLSYFEKPTS